MAAGSYAALPSMTHWRTQVKEVEVGAVKS